MEEGDSASAEAPGREACQKARRSLSRLLVSGEELGQAKKGGGQGGVDRGELFPRIGFIVSNMSARPKGVIHFYNGRATAKTGLCKVCRPS